jgi:hypothetical protein
MIGACQKHACARGCLKNYRGLFCSAGLNRHVFPINAIEDDYFVAAMDFFGGSGDCFQRLRRSAIAIIGGSRVALRDLVGHGLQQERREKEPQAAAHYDRSLSPWRGGKTRRPVHRGAIPDSADRSAAPIRSSSSSGQEHCEAHIQEETNIAAVGDKISSSGPLFFAAKPRLALADRHAFWSNLQLLVGAKIPGKSAF